MRAVVGRLFVACAVLGAAHVAAFSGCPPSLGAGRALLRGRAAEACDSPFSRASLGQGRPRGRNGGASVVMQEGKGIGGWIQKALRENMGNAPEEPTKKPAPRAKQDLRPVKTEEEDDGTVKPDFNFKFSSKAQSLLDLDTSSVGEKSKKAPKAKKTKSTADSEAASEEEDGVDRRFYEVALDRPTGIEFATDLSLKYVYIMEIKENSAADLNPVQIDVGNQLVAINGEECIGKRFADVAALLAKDPSKPLKFRFFRGSKQELLTAIGKEDYVATSSRVTAIMPGDSDEEKTVDAAAGANMRDALIGAGVQVYRIQSGRFSNCNGKQLCGTCIVDVKEGAEFTNSKSIDEENFLRKMPESYRLSCCVNVYGDVKVKTLPETGKKFIEFS
mmetsp:Transcript_6009/g.15299  ORF Transcript_6009/g.15299 Transcript_6009/m.15299 type:complete len:389 (-) Transcript_6009:2101-3267(-)